MARLRSIIITNGGTGYSSPPTVVFNGITGQTVAPAVSVTVFGGSVTEIAITNAGTFTGGPTSITLSGGGGTSAAAVPFSEQPAVGTMMSWAPEDYLFNWGQLCPIHPALAGVSGNRELDNPWRNSLGTLELNVTAVPGRPGPTSVPGTSGGQ